MFYIHTAHGWIFCSMITALHYAICMSFNEIKLLVFFMMHAMHNCMSAVTVYFLCLFFFVFFVILFVSCMMLLSSLSSSSLYYCSIISDFLIMILKMVQDSGLLNILTVYAAHSGKHTQPFYGSLDFVRDNPGEPVPEGTFRHLLDFLEQNEDNTGRCTNHLDGLPPHPD